MTEKSKNKWANWASRIHDGGKGSLEQFDVHDEDLLIAQKIFDARDNVAKLKKLKSADKAWGEVKGNLNKGRKRWLGFLRYAAVFAVAVLLTGGLFLMRTTSEISDTFACISAPNGQISNITLFDGTNVWLNAGSNLKYKQNFGGKNREVFLEGEAFFSVAKNKEIPFIVHAGNSQIKVHGTEFNVKAYGNEPVIETVLVEGKVEFLSGGGAVMMKPGEQLLFTRKSGVVKTKEVNTGEFTSWKGGKIYFNNETLFNLTRQLERWYEVTFTFQDERIKNYRFSGVINKERSLDYTLKIIQDINKVKFKINKEQIEIMNK
jgi:ferric-dicitrate binding protein FerR (iron transport regulator)